LKFNTHVFYDSAILEFNYDKKLSLEVFTPLRLNLNNAEFLFLMNDGTMLEFNELFFTIKDKKMILDLTESDIKKFKTKTIHKLIFRVMTSRYNIKIYPNKKEANQFKKEFKKIY
jgi:hypothetical protein